MLRRPFACVARQNACQPQIMLQMPHKTVTLPKTAEPPACIVSCAAKPSRCRAAAAMRRAMRCRHSPQDSGICAKSSRRRAPSASTGNRAAEPVGTVEQCGQNECLHQHDQQLPAQFDRLVLVDPHTPDGRSRSPPLPTGPMRTAYEERRYRTDSGTLLIVCSIARRSDRAKWHD